MMKPKMEMMRRKKKRKVRMMVMMRRRMDQTLMFDVFVVRPMGHLLCRE
jgi:hypothetical protein